MVRCSITIDNYEHSRKRLYTSDINVPQGFNPKSVKAYCKFFVYNAQIVFFTTTSANLAIWLANLPSSIRVHTMLLASMCRAMPFCALWKKKTHFLWCWYCSKKRQIKMWFIVVCTLFDNDYLFCILSESAKVFERKVWRVQVAHSHNGLQVRVGVFNCQ